MDRPSPSPWSASAVRPRSCPRRCGATARPGSSAPASCTPIPTSVPGRRSPSSAPTISTGPCPRLSEAAAPIVHFEGGPDEGAWPTAITASDEYGDATQRAINAQAVGLMIFAVVAAVAGGFVLAQAVSRQLAGSDDEAATLAALGLARRARALALATPVILAVGLGVLLGAAVALAVSPLLPIGLARRAEARPGVWFDPWVALLGVVFMVGGAVVWALWTAGRLGRRAVAGSRADDRSSATGRRILTVAGSVPSVLIGLRYATDRRRGGTSVRARTAMVGLAVAVAGLVGAGVMVRSFDVLTSAPTNWGWNWSSTPDAFGDDDPTAALAADPRLAAVGQVAAGTVVLDGRITGGFSMTALRGDPTLTTTGGRLPSGPSEVALGEKTMSELGVGFGDTVRALGADGSQLDLVVVGSAVFPPGLDNNPLNDGAALTPDGLDAVLQGGGANEVVTLTYPPGTDATAFESALADEYQLSFNAFTEPTVPGAVRYVSESRDVAIAVGLFFVALGALALIHTMALSGRRRRGELAVLRTLGLDRRGVRLVLLCESLAIAVVALVIGVPAGLIAGRLVWRAVVDGLGAVADPAVPWRAMVVVVPATLVMAAVVALPPVRAVLRRRPAVALRAE